MTKLKVLSQVLTARSGTSPKSRTPGPTIIKMCTYLEYNLFCWFLFQNIPANLIAFIGFKTCERKKKRCSVKEKRPITNHTALWTLNFLKTQLVRGNSKKEALLFFNPSGLSPTCILLKESTSSATWQQLNLRQNSADLQAKQHFHMYYGEHHSHRNRPIGPQCLCRT